MSDPQPTLDQRLDTLHARLDELHDRLHEKLDATLKMVQQLYSTLTGIPDKPKDAA